jgi:hypothetical protein
MDKEKEQEWEEKIEKKFEGWCSSKKGKKNATCHGSGGALYFVGFIGSAVYYIQAADSFWSGVVGVLKALVWPAFLVYEAMKVLGM